MSIIRLSGGITFKNSEGKSIFQAARDSGVLLDHSCLTGRCSSCKGRLIEGQTKELNAELGLSKEEKAKGFLLTCARSAVSDVTIDIQALTDIPLLETPKTVPCKVSRFEYLTENLIGLELRFPPNQNIKFLPGQYVNLIKGNIRRSYSIAGEDNGKLLFYIKNYPDGAFSEYLFNAIKANDLLRLHGPLGTFCYRKNDVSNSIFMATGTGIAPVKAMLDHLNQNPEYASRKRLYLFHGVRKTPELIFSPDYPNLNLEYFPCLSREKKTDYHQGYIQDVLLTQEIALEDSDVYACGSPQMIEESRQKLIEQGLRENLFYSDAFLISS